MSFKHIFVFAAMFALGCVAASVLRPSVAPERIAEAPKKLVPNDFVAVARQPLVEIDGDAEFDFRKSRKMPIQMVETGNGFHGDEIVARNGESWLGLFPGENGLFSLRSAPLSVTRAKDEIVDKAAEMSGKNVQTKEKSIPVFLLRGAENLKQGTVKQLFGNGDLTVGEDGRDYDLLKPGYNREFDAGAGEVTLKVVRGLVGEKEVQALVLERDGIGQTLYVYDFPDEIESIGTLYWAGDLDRDGWPDFYMSLYFHDNVDDKMLFLSSKAKKNKIVSLVANFRITGC